MLVFLLRKRCLRLPGVDEGAPMRSRIWKPLIRLDHLAGLPVLSGSTGSGSIVLAKVATPYGWPISLVPFGPIRLNSSRIIVLILPFF